MPLSRTWRSQSDNNSNFQAGRSTGKSFFRLQSKPAAHRGNVRSRRLHSHRHRRRSGISHRNRCVGPQPTGRIRPRAGHRAKSHAVSAWQDVRLFEQRRRGSHFRTRTQPVHDPQHIAVHFNTSELRRNPPSAQKRGIRTEKVFAAGTIAAGPTVRTDRPGARLSTRSEF